MGRRVRVAAPAAGQRLYVYYGGPEAAREVFLADRTGLR